MTRPNTTKGCRVTEWIGPQPLYGTAFCIRTGEESRWKQHLLKIFKYFLSYIMKMHKQYKHNVCCNEPFLIVLHNFFISFRDASGWDIGFKCFNFSSHASFEFCVLWLSSNASDFRFSFFSLPILRWKTCTSLKFQTVYFTARVCKHGAWFQHISKIALGTPTSTNSFNALYHEHWFYIHDIIYMV